MGEMVGAVTAERHGQLVATGRELVLTISAAQFRLGDLALEIAPVGSGGREAPAAFQVETVVRAFAEDVGVAAATLEHYRYVSVDKRVPGICHYVHRIVASVEDEDERFSVLLSAPRPEWSRSGRWTGDAAKRMVGQTPAIPVSKDEKVHAIGDLAQDVEVAAAAAVDILSRPEVTEATSVAARAYAVAELTRDPAVAAQVATSLLKRPEVVAAAAPEARVSVVHVLARDTSTAARVATDLLRRPEVAAATMRDAAAKRQVNRAQVEHAQRDAEPARAAVAPALAALDHSMVFMDLVGSIAAFVTGIGRAIPRLAEHQLSDQERAVVHANIGKARATCDWLATSVDTGNTSMDDQLAALLQGE